MEIKSASACNVPIAQFQSPPSLWKGGGGEGNF